MNSPATPRGHDGVAPILDIANLSKTYAGGFTALRDVSLSVDHGEIFALLGPNGAGKTTLISIVCGIVMPTSGAITVGGRDILLDYRLTRAQIGLVPQELTTDAFETPWATACFSRGLFGLKPDPGHIERVLRELSLWDKRDAKIMTLSGGMKRRVLIAKALAHQPRLLFLDEPTAGVDVELRKDMWGMIRRLREEGVTIILTTHYIDEAEEMADRVGVIDKGRLLLVEEKRALIARLGERRMRLELETPIAEIPADLAAFRLERADEGASLIYRYDGAGAHPPVADLMAALSERGLIVRDLVTRHSSLEEIFVNLTRRTP
jgi:ABC-2 type transport system ATP-binding protein